MKYLIDTHILLWWLNDDKKLNISIKEVLANPDNEIYVSIVSPWELSIKLKIKKLKLKATLQTVFNNITFTLLPIKLEHILAQFKLSLHHKDPFDRIIIAQAQTEDLVIITNDTKFKKYKVKLLG